MIVRARDNRATSEVCFCCWPPSSSPSSSAGRLFTPRGSAMSTSSTPRSIAPSMSRNFFMRASFHGQKGAKSSDLSLCRIFETEAQPLSGTCSMCLASSTTSVPPSTPFSITSWASSTGGLSKTLESDVACWLMILSWQYIKFDLITPESWWWMSESDNILWGVFDGNMRRANCSFDVSLYTLWLYDYGVKIVGRGPSCKCPMFPYFTFYWYWWL